ncbi:peptidoglycan/LPS O-acetylase OafA/YrhL [Curtobacterium pusillum]|uniref:Peptidoglycan/LPS O-acetylase OafA/YrhL n=1 Tax=Curtobacterium pusillum TaxID=69373 RepID=A0AAW3T688_9MICO|nr:acyltransferase family protein [Curtobacterium pusillum]MBA8990047.1 peptidoglycan/LPS O-acetylase OafA/YrhL [Curtobacterium pusillum]
MSKHALGQQSSGTAKRADIQLLRAFAVLAVITYHFWPFRLPGGFVGVDVFFVISGYLICGHLFDELLRTGTIRLAHFWARRGKRLLPAALTVIVVTALGTLLLLPRTVWETTFRQLAASAVYVQNWSLAADSVDYLAADNAPTSVQHFWSLSVEEQFYIVVPLLVLVVALVLRRRSRRTVLKTVLTMIALITVGSFVLSVYQTAMTPGPAYFSTLTRAWEFGAGALIAAVPAKFSGQPVARWIAVILGVVGLGASLVVISPEDPFPGSIAALPVIATALLLAARSVPSATGLLGVGTQLGVGVGDRSYSLYLWHWPALVFAHALLGEEISWRTKLVLLVAVAIAAELSFRFVETPLRRRRVQRHRQAYAFAAASLVAALVVAVPLQASANMLESSRMQDVQRAQARAAAATACFGAAAMVGGAHCDQDLGDLTPSPEAAPEDIPAAYSNRCHATTNGDTTNVCQLGDGPRRVALIGDSHALSWEPALEAVAKQRGWTIDAYTKSACPLTTAPTTNGDASIRASCVAWRQIMQEKIAAAKPYDLVITAASATAARFRSNDEAIAGYREVWAPMAARGAQIVVLQDTPRAPEGALDCLAQPDSAVRGCSLPRDQAFPSPDLMAAAAAAGHATVLDFNKYLCDDEWCPTAIGGVVVYRDTHHMTTTFSRTLAPYVSKAFASLGF